MIIGIDARFYGPQNKGLGRYTQKLIENLEKIDKENQYVIFLRRENWQAYQPQNSNFKKVLFDCRWYTLKEQILMPFKIYQHKINLMHFPHFNVPIFFFGKFVVTIHDLILRRFPTRRASTLSPFLYLFKNLAYRLVIWSAVKRARKIISVSNFVKNDILKYFQISPEKIEVIYEGTTTINDFQFNLFPCQKGRQKKEDNCLLKYGIKKPYLLYVGNAYPHKNLERLISVCRQLILKDGLDFQLVLVGQDDYFYQRLKKEAFNFHLIGKIFKYIIFTGFVSEEDLSKIYQNALVYVFPSLCEGFGLPPLEAMSHGIPVLSSNATCLPEILGKAALYFNPENEEEIAEAIKKIFFNQKLRQNLILKGFKKIKKYNWQKMALQTQKIYIKTVE